jgi:hypothetical protein
MGNHPIAGLKARDHFSKRRIADPQFNRPPEPVLTGFRRSDQGGESLVAKPTNRLERDAAHSPRLDQEFRGGLAGVGPNFKRKTPKQTSNFRGAERGRTESAASALAAD